MEDLNTFEQNTPTQEVENVQDNKKIIQITFSDSGLPNINYSNMTIPEILGTIDLSKAILQSKTVGNSILQQHLYTMAQSIQ